MDEQRSDARHCHRVIAMEDLRRLKKRPDVDTRHSIGDGTLIIVKLKASTDELASVWTCDGRIQGVPSDKNCGFHALLLASSIFDGGNALGTPMPKSVEEARDLFVRFLKEEREDIEREFTAAHGAQRAVVPLWKDISSSELCLIPSGVTFDQFCRSIPRMGLSGHCLGTTLSIVELHILGRALGVTVHCVSSVSQAVIMFIAAASESKQGALEQQFEGFSKRSSCNSIFWKLQCCSLPSSNLRAFKKGEDQRFYSFQDSAQNSSTVRDASPEKLFSWKTSHKISLGISNRAVNKKKKRGKLFMILIRRA